MDTLPPPNCIEVQNFQFKLHRRIRAFKSANQFAPSQLNVLASASRFGLLFLGTPDNQLHVFQLRSIVQGEGLKCPRRIIHFPGQIMSLSLNCTQELLSIAYFKNNTLFAGVYETKSCAEENPRCLNEIILTPTNNVQLTKLLWNPCQADMLAAVTSDGVLSVYLCKSSTVQVQSKPASAKCFSWSPKGKQLVTGSIDGSLCQWKPDLSLVKKIPVPSHMTEAVAIQWLSNTQFCVVYKDNESKPCVTIVNTPKTGNCTCYNYEDICYSMGDTRPMQFYITHIPPWGVILVSSSNSMEVGVLGSVDQINWQQWIQMDEARAELPLTEEQQECYPIGSAIDDSAIFQLPWGENESLPYMPALHILSHVGLMMTFYCINLGATQTSICSVPNEVMIPQHLCLSDLEPPSSVPQQPVSQVVASTNDSSFAFPSITSTPAAPKPTNTNQESGSKFVGTNLFGTPKPPETVLSTKLSAEPPKYFSNNQQQPPIESILKVPDIHKAISTSTIKTEVYSKIDSVPLPKENVKLQSTDTNPTKTVHEDPAKTKKQTPSNETLKAAYLKEINDFQSYLVEMKKLQNINTQIGTTTEIKFITEILEKNDLEPLNKSYSYSDVRHQITLIKQYLIKMCSFIIEAKLQPESLELGQLAQLDPVSQEKVTSIKKMMYYVESQLKQVTDVLDHQWNNFREHCMKDVASRQQMNNGDVMKMPTLDQVYQPLVKHQDILMKQLATVKTLQKLLDNMKPQMFNSNVNKPIDKSLKSTHTLSTLTKNLLNLSIQTTDIQDVKYQAIYENEAKYSIKKHNVLRDFLGDRQIVRIKPVKFEFSNKWKSLVDQEQLNLVKQAVKSENNLGNQNIQNGQIGQKSEVSTVKPNSVVVSKENTLMKENNALNNLNKMVLNVGESKIIPKSEPSLQSSNNLFNVPSKAVNSELQSSLKSLPSANVVVKPTSSLFETIQVSNNSFMGQKICSPTVKDSVLAPDTNSKNNMNKFEVKPQTQSVFSTPIVKQPQKDSTPSEPQINIKTEKVIPTVTTSSIGSSYFGNINISKESSFAPTSAVSVIPEASKISFGNVENSKSSFSFISNANANSFAPSKFVNTTSAISVPPMPKTSESKPIDAIQTVKKEPVKIISSIETKETTVKNDTIPKPSSSSPASIFSSAVEKSASQSNTSVTTSVSSSVDSSASTTWAKPVKSESLPDTLPVSVLAATVNVSDTPISSSSSSPAIATTQVSTATPSTVVTPSATSLFSGAVSSLNPTTAPSLFGTPTTSVFSSPVSTPSVFGSNGSSGAVFGNTTPNTSAFGSPQSPGFGTAAPAASSLFASANANLGTTGNMFESLSVTSTASTFGNASPPTCAASIFGGSNNSVPSTISSLFGSATISTTTSSFGSPSNTSGSIFGSSSFGQPSGNPLFGGTSAFGQPQTQGNVFGGGSSFGAFGSSPSNMFGQSGQNTTVFGAQTPSTTPGSAFGGGNQAQSLFGSPSSFGSPTTQGSVFGGSPSFASKPMFGQSSFGSPTSGGFGAFSTGGESVGQAGFGSPTSFGKSAGFGATPAFGSPSGFGSNPAFGGSPSFGGSPGKLFGSPGSENAFGNTQSSTFENLATQSTLTFGNLAQQSQLAPQAAPFQSSKSFTSWR